MAPLERRAFIAELTHELFSPVPAHMGRVHPSWVQHLLDKESPAVVAVAIQGLPAALVSELVLPPLPEPALDPPLKVRRQVYQLVLGLLEAMPAEAEGEPLALTDWADLPSWRPARVRQSLLQLGCLVLGALIEKGDPSRGATLLSHFATYAAQITAAMQRPIPLPRTILPPSMDQQQPREVLMLLGLQSAGPCIPERCRRQVAQLLGRPEGLCLLEGIAEDQRQRATMLAVMRRADAQCREASNGATP